MTDSDTPEYMTSSGEFSDSDSFSSGWEESSDSYYYDEEDEYMEEDGEHMDMPPPKTRKTMDELREEVEKEMRFELVVLPRPVFRTSWGDCKKEQEEEELETSSSSSDSEPLPSSINEEPVPVVSPWKKLEPCRMEEDPWKFLTPEPLTPPCSPRQPHHHHRQSSHHGNNRNNYGNNRNNHHHHNHSHGGGGAHHHGTTTTRIDNSDTNKLCKYKKDCRMNEKGNCTMVHDLSEWKPRICRFDTKCKRKNNCGYHHHDIPVHVYLSQMIKRKDTIYNKNAALYSKYLHH